MCFEYLSAYVSHHGHSKLWKNDSNLYWNIIDMKSLAYYLNTDKEED